MNNLELSIIIPVYNAEKFIARCINSIVNLNLPNWEILLIDDGSTDSSALICQSYAESNDAIRLLKKTNGGVSSARNLGIEHAKGNYIFFIDSDDFVTKDFKVIVETCISKKLPFTFFPRLFLTRNTLEFDYRPLWGKMTEVQERLYKINNFDEILGHKFFCSGSGEVLLRRDLIGRVRFDESRSILEDFDFFFNILCESDQIYFLDIPSIVINDFVPESLTRKRIKFGQKQYLAESNLFLRSRKKIQKRVYWIENYFDVKRYSWNDRVRHLLTFSTKHIKYFQLNKYFLGYAFFVFGIDINKIRTKIKK
jgi:glycosyltransferase involved in cell wall biosynthesis